MRTIFSILNKSNLNIYSKTGFNPKRYYATTKAVWKRFANDWIGIRYQPDNESVNIIIDDIETLYCGIPKIGTKTFLKELAENRVLGSGARVYNAPLASLMERDPTLRNYYSFSFTRNPWSRVVSVYNSKICHPSVASVRTYFIRYRGLRYGMPFNEFIEWLCLSEEGRDEVADRHWISQHYFLYEKNQLLVSRVCRYENMEEEWDRICETLLGRQHPLGNYSRKTSAGLDSYREYYDDYLADLVRKRYSKDIELFGYEF